MTASTTAGAILIALSISFAVVASAKHHGVVNRPKGHIRKRKRSGDNEAATRMAADKRRVHHDPAGEDHMVIQNEEIEFWTRLLQGSMPVPVPTTIRPQPSTPRPTNSLPPSAPRPNSNPEPTNRPSRPPMTEPPINSCGLTSAERESQIIDELSAVSFSALFDETDSPQSQALEWILNKDSAFLCPGASGLVQRYTLGVFYYSTEGDSWNECNAPGDFSSETSISDANSACTLTTTNATQIFPNDIRGSNAWLSPSDECTWGGVSCYSSGESAGRVNVVEFEENLLRGTLPSEVEQLSDMRFFALERGGMGGTIPASIGNLRSLLLLDFDFNRLSGTLPSSLWSLTSLRQLDLNDNNLLGTLSSEIGNLGQLRFFQIDNNYLTGGIPEQLGGIPKISLIGLSGNDFEGIMPEEVCDLRPSPLQTLVVDCDIECSIPQCCTSCVPV